MNNLLPTLIIIILFSCSEPQNDKNNQQQITSIDNELLELTIIKDSLKNQASLILNKYDNIVSTSIELNDTFNKPVVKYKNDSKKDSINKVIESNYSIKDSIELLKAIRPNHTTWNILTKKYVSFSGKVNYIGFKSQTKLLNSYIIHLGKNPPTNSWSKNEKLAYWFNLYNAATIQLISKSYPIKSIKSIHNGKPWDKSFIVSGTKTYSLNQIENIIVRPNFNEPRLHVAFNCAAISCPKLLNEAFTAIKLNTQLNKLSKEWINDSSKNKVKNGNIQISKIFKWYSKDFKKGVIPFINQYLTNKISESTPINYLTYNWNLND